KRSRSPEMVPTVVPYRSTRSSATFVSELDDQAPSRGAKDGERAVESLHILALFQLDDVPLAHADPVGEFSLAEAGVSSQFGEHVSERAGVADRGTTHVITFPSSRLCDEVF